MSSTAESASLKRTPFYDIHLALGAKIVPFAGYEMPVHYPTGITAEHHAVRRGCGLFDVSHMGEFRVTGAGAVDFVNYVTSNDASALAVGQVQYSAILNERGTFEDDCLVYRFGSDMMMVVNASNREKDLAHISKHLAKFDAELDLIDVSNGVALLALQGPKAQEILQPLTDLTLESIGYYHFGIGSVAGCAGIMVSRTGYTGEDGFELYFAATDITDTTTRIWNALVQTGGVTPAGLGCRDSLRLEMGMALYGSDIDYTVTPYEANLGWIVKMNKGDFVGRAALVDEKLAGAKRKLVGFTIAERAFPRHGYPVLVNGVPSGLVMSGTISPSCGIPIGTAYVPAAHAKPGNTIEVEIREKRLTATIVELPFYKHASHR